MALSQMLVSAPIDASQTGDKSRPLLRFNIEVLLITSGILFSWVFVRTFINWLGIDFWQDIRAYEANFTDEYYYYQALNVSFIQFFTQEIGWIYVVQYFMSFNLTIQQSLYFISIISCAIISYFISSKSRTIFSLLLLINPIFIDFVIGQSRSALATAILLMAFKIRFFPIQIIMIVAASSIHFSVPLFAALYYLYRLLRHREFRYFLGDRKRGYLAAAIVTAFLFETSRTYILYSLEDRRLESLFDHEPSLMLAVAFMLFVPSYLVVAREKPVSLAFFFYSTCAALFLFATFNGFYASRYVAVAYPMLCVMQAEATGRGRWLFAGHMIAFSLVYFAFWL